MGGCCGLSDMPQKKQLQPQLNTLQRRDKLIEYALRNKITCIMQVIENNKSLQTICNLNLDRINVGQFDSLLECFAHLQILSLKNSNINQMKFLYHSCQYLQELYLQGNFIQKIQGLDSLNNLKILDISNQIGQINIIIDDNKIMKIQGLNKLLFLKQLRLGNNKILKIQGLQELQNLQKLGLELNSITIIENLSKLLKLELLILGGNLIYHIQNLSELINLKVLSLQNNKITKIQHIYCIKNLCQVILSSNFIDIEKQDFTIKQIQKRGIQLIFNEQKNSNNLTLQYPTQQKQTELAKLLVTTFRHNNNT